MDYKIEKLNEKMLVCGLTKPTSASSSFDDIQTLSKEYQAVKNDFVYVCKPVYTIVATKTDALFMGNVVTKKNKHFDHIELDENQLLCKVEVKGMNGATLPLKVAKIKNNFYKWLKSSDYKSSDILDLEVYHYRQRWFRKSYKMVLEVWFLVKKKGEQ